MTSSFSGSGDQRRRDQRRRDPRWHRRIRVLTRLARRLRLRFRAGFADFLARVQRGEHIFMVLTAILIGVLAAYGAIGFHHLIHLAQRLFFADAETTLAGFAAVPAWQRLLVPSLGGLAVGIFVTRFAPEVRGSGIPQVMEAVARHGGAIRPRVALAKAAAVALTLGSGGSAGREGPIVHIGSAIGSAIGQFLQVSARRVRTFVACGSAAGIAATFNAPIAGALFAMEVVLRDLGVVNLSPVVISSVVAVVISRHHLGDFPAFEVPAYELESSRELVLYAMLGVLAALVAVIFMRTLGRVTDLFERLPVAEWARPGLGGFGVGLVALAFPSILGVGYPTINAALRGEMMGAFLLLLLAAKILATSFTVGSGAAGGIFAPSLFLGSALGASFGHLVHGLFPTWTATHGAYALVAMGALVSATTHAPITAILIIFELTNDYQIIPPLMLACVVSVLLSRLWHRESIYTAQLVRRGVHLEQGADPNLLRGIVVQDAMLQDPPKAPPRWPLSQILSHLEASPHPELPVVDDKGTLLGSIGLGEVKPVLADAEMLGTLVVAADVMMENPPFLIPGDSLDLAMHLFGRHDRHALAVCSDSKTRILVGMVTREEVIAAYNQRVFETDLTGGFSSLVEAGQGGRRIEVLAGIHLAEVEIPFALVGMTLKEAKLRRRYEVEVVLIRTANTDDTLEGRSGKVPRPDVELQAGDRLLVMGTPEAIAALQR